MLTAYTIDSGNENAGAACTYCHASLDLGDVAVNCPRCKSPYHIDCWKEYRSRCAVLECPGRGKVSASVTPPAPPPVPDLLLDEIEIEPVEPLVAIPTEVLESIEILPLEDESSSKGIWGDDLEIDDLSETLDFTVDSSPISASYQNSPGTDLAPNSARETLSNKLARAWAGIRSLWGSQSQGTT